jgi:hypothetical protein
MREFCKIALVSCCLVGSLIASEAFAQPKADPLGASLGLTPDTKSLPLWTKPPETAVQEMARTIQTLQQGIMLVGDPNVGTGTAFVISKEHRLLATNAHVADMMKEGKMLGIRNGTAVLYEVDKAWYHPGARRYKNARLSIRSQNPADGETDPNSPDVAVLHLADGPELPQELALGSVEEVENCFGQPIGMLGYPGHDTEGWPKLGGKAQATLREGIICRLMDFYGDVSGPNSEMQKLQHSLASWFGFSGSPLFLPNGHVIGLHNSGRGVTIKGQDEEIKRHVELAYGVRVDCLWELLAYHHLDDKVPLPIDKSKLLLARYERPDPALERYRQAEKLVKLAEQLLAEDRYAEAGDKCNEATKICPGYSRAYFVRAMNYTVYNLNRFPGGVVEGEPVNPERLRYAQLSYEDAKTYLSMNPNDPDALLFICQKISDVDLYGRTYSEANQNTVINTATKLIDNPSVPNRLKARAYSTRAVVRTHDINRSELRDVIYADFANALRLDPYNANLWNARWQYDRAGSDLEASDGQRARELSEAAQQASVAWRLATTSDDAARDGRKAWELANKACQTTNFQYANYLGALAAAYAACGDFEHAVEFGKKSLQFAEPDEKDLLRLQLQAYENKQPYREPQD